jgi:hypothetical protein
MQLASGAWGVVVPPTAAAQLPARRSLTLRTPLAAKGPAAAGPGPLRLSFRLVERVLQTVVCDLGNCVVTLPPPAADAAADGAGGGIDDAAAGGGADPRALGLSVVLDVLDAAAVAAADAGSGWAAKLWVTAEHHASARQWAGAVSGFLPAP